MITKVTSTFIIQLERYHDDMTTSCSRRGATHIYEDKAMSENHRHHHRHHHQFIIIVSRTTQAASKTRIHNVSKTEGLTPRRVQTHADPDI